MPFPVFALFTLIPFFGRERWRRERPVERAERGSCIVAGARDVAFGGYLKAGEDVRLNPAFDVAGLVEVRRDAFLKNDAAAGLDPDDLNAVVGIGAEATLPGGRHYLHQLGGVGLFRIELAPDAELDVFVRDNLVVTGAAVFGDKERPSATRIYVGGTGDVAIAGASAFVGNLYAPQANLLS